MKYLAAIIILISAMAYAEWLGCDIPDASEQVTQYEITIDAVQTVTVPYTLNQAKDAVLLMDISQIGAASFEVVAINSQGRRSDVSDPFVLLPRPSASSGYRIIQE